MGKKKHNEFDFIDMNDAILDVSRTNIDENEKLLIERENDMIKESVKCSQDISNEIIQNRMNSLSFSTNNKNTKQNIKQINPQSKNEKIPTLNQVKLEKFDNKNYLNNDLQVKVDNKNNVYLEKLQSDESLNVNKFKSSHEPNQSHFKAKDKEIEKDNSNDILGKPVKPMNIDENIRNNLLKHGLKKANTKTNIHTNIDNNIFDTSDEIAIEDNKNSSIQLKENTARNINDISNEYKKDVFNKRELLEEQKNKKKTNPEKHIHHKTLIDVEIEEINKLIQSTKDKKEINDSNQTINKKDLIKDVSKQRFVDSNEYERMKKEASMAASSINLELYDFKNINNETSTNNNEKIEDINDIVIEQTMGNTHAKPKMSPVKKNIANKDIYNSNRNILDKNRVFEDEIDKGMPKFDKELKPLQRKENNIDDDYSTLDEYLHENSNKQISSAFVIFLTIIVLFATIGVIAFFFLK